MFARLDPVGVVESVVMPFFQSDGEDDDGAAQASCRLHPALTHSALILPDPAPSDNYLGSIYDIRRL